METIKAIFEGFGGSSSENGKDGSSSNPFHSSLDFLTEFLMGEKIGHPVIPSYLVVLGLTLQRYFSLVANPKKNTGLFYNKIANSDVFT